MSDQPRLLIASNNAGKVEEFRDLLAGCGWEILGPADLGLVLDVEESGSTYAENARLKASHFCQASGLASLADDSGLEVDALAGEPGPLHHLKGWDGSDQSDRLARLIEAMSDVPPGQRSARFRAVLVVASPDGQFLEAEGTCEGQVGQVVLGDQGFGYDPVFFPDGLDRTMAQLSLEEKNRISHRARAARLMRARLERLASSPGAVDTR